MIAEPSLVRVLVPVEDVDPLRIGTLATRISVAWADVPRLLTERMRADSGWTTGLLSRSSGGPLETQVVADNSSAPRRVSNLPRLTSPGKPFFVLSNRSARSPS